MKSLRFVLSILLLFAASFPTFAGKMQKTKEPLVTPPDKATIVFMRPGSFVGRAVAVPVFDVTKIEAEFIGIVDAGKKFAYSVPPGEYDFATTIFGGPLGVRFYKAKVAAGKTYYFRAHIMQGIWGLEPVRGDALTSDDFKQWDEGTALTVNSADTIAWGEDNRAKTTKYAQDLKPANISAENTLGVEDGR